MSEGGRALRAGEGSRNVDSPHQVTKVEADCIMNWNGRICLLPGKRVDRSSQVGQDG